MMERPEAQPETGAGRGWQRGLPVELLVGIVLSVILAALVGLAGGAMTAPPEAPAVRLIMPIVNEMPPQDFDPRDPLVRCTQFETHLHCVREES